MKLTERYQEGIFDLLQKVQMSQKEAIQKAGELVASAAEQGKRIYLGRICHGIEQDLITRGGGPAFYREYKEGETKLQAGDVLFVSSVSGRTASVVNLAYDSMQMGINVVALTSMDYARVVEAVHPSGKKLYEIVTHTIDNCAPAGEAMLQVEGIEAKFAAVSGIASDFIMWSVTASAVEKMLTDGYAPGIYKSINFPGGQEHFESVNRHYEEFGW